MNEQQIRSKEDETPIGKAVNMLFERRDGLLEDYQDKIIDLSQTYNLDKYQTLYSALQKINEDVSFVSHILALIRDQTRFNMGDVPTGENNEHND